MLPPPVDRSELLDPLEAALEILGVRAKALSDGANDLFHAVARVVRDGVQARAAEIVEQHADHSFELGAKGLGGVRAAVDAWCRDVDAATRRRLVMPDGSPPIWPQAWTFPVPPSRIPDVERLPFAPAGEPPPPRVDNAIRDLIASGVAPLAEAGYDLAGDPEWETRADGRPVRFAGAYRASPTLLSAMRLYSNRRRAYIGALDRVLWLRAVDAAAAAEAAANLERDAKRATVAQRWAEARTLDS